jgi:nitroimidazol reductase NimA-like FMN-containing flavoprotein (pyridoxamine 5'-phosphate oxidase superfamily)
MIGVMSTDEIEAALSRSRLGRIGCSLHDRPYIVPINYVYDGEHVYAYSHTGRKVHIMREQPHICFQVDEIEGPSRWWSVVAEGRYEELTGEEQRRDALRRLGMREDGLIPRVVDPTNGAVLFRLKLGEKTGRFERRDA